jgi:hypothetical protein
MIISSEATLPDLEAGEQTRQNSIQEIEALARLLTYAAREAAALNLDDSCHLITLAASRLAGAACPQERPFQYNDARLRNRANGETPTLAFAART